MSFPILSSLISAPIVGAVLLLFVRGADREQTARTARQVALVVSVLVFAETLLLWARFNPASDPRENALQLHDRILPYRLLRLKIAASPCRGGIRLTPVVAVIAYAVNPMAFLTGAHAETHRHP